MLIDCRDMHFAYPGSVDKTVLSIRQWAVPKHEHTFLYGPSGAGKSTLLNIVSGVLAGYQGQVSVLGQPLEKLSNRQRDRFRAAYIGYVFQQFNLIPFLSAVENIQLASQFSRDKQKDIATRTKDLLSSLNIDSAEWAQPVSTLSIGQQQRVAIARAFINRPKLLIADEPTSSLDEANRDRFMTMLMEQAAENNTTLLFVSHDKSLSSYFNRVESLLDINQSKERD